MKMLLGYIGTLAGGLLGLLTLASLGAATPNYLVSAALLLVALLAFGAGWYGLSAERGEAS